VVVIEHEPTRRDVTEAILLKLRFSVVPVESVEKALALTTAIRPDVIVCPASDAEELREGLINPNIPVVAVTDQAGTVPDEADVLIENIRFALRARVIPIA
jgi:CheY-like chemotaxis protein